MLPPQTAEHLLSRQTTTLYHSEVICTSSISSKDNIKLQILSYLYSRVMAKHFFNRPVT